MCTPIHSSLDCIGKVRLPSLQRRLGLISATQHHVLGQVQHGAIVERCPFTLVVECLFHLPLPVELRAMYGDMGLNEIVEGTIWTESLSSVPCTSFHMRRKDF